MPPSAARFAGLTVQVYVPDIRAGVDFYTRALGRGPNFAPTPDFHEWDHLAPGVTFQVGEGTPRPTYPFRLKVADIDRERARVVRDARPALATPVKRFEGLVAVCDFVDPWGNTFGLYQVLFEGGEPPRLTGSNREHMTEVERRIAGGRSSRPGSADVARPRVSRRPRTAPGGDRRRRRPARGS
ncbi:MAG TPA: VOC family protein [Candidatus Tectomicrobia bacterium]|nr:VOC family protein [Candidatus Tectomicrobia bacterium]